MNSGTMFRRRTLWFLSGWILLSVLILAGCTPGILPPDPGFKDGGWTVMVFVNADNNLEPFGWKDLRAMEMVGSTPQVNIVVQFDTLSGPARRYHIQQQGNQSWPGMISSPVLQELGEVNMGDPVTLLDFIRFSTEQFPARRYALVVWNHGTGFKDQIRNISFDDTFQDSITIPELGWVLSRAMAYTRGPIEMLGLDACLMALTEVACEVAPYARVMVASQENEPADGWDYSAWLKDLVANPSMNGYELGRSVVDTYMAFYAYGSVTQSVVDLRQMEGVAGALDRLAREVMADQSVLPAVYRQIGQSSFSFRGDEDYIDLMDFLLRVEEDSRITSPAVREAARMALLETRNAVYYNRAGGTTAGNARGISIYFPTNPYRFEYDQLAFSRDTAWPELLLHLNRASRSEPAISEP